MGLKERLMADLREAMRSHDVNRREAIRMVRAAIQNSEIEVQRELSDAEIEQVISREIKRREEALVLFRRGGRQDLVTEEEAQLVVLRAYLPEQLGEEQIRQVVLQIIQTLGATSLKEMGPVMKEAMQQLQGCADGRLVNQVVRELLAS